MTKTKRSVLVPIDFKIYCLKSLDYALKLQSEIDCQIHLLHVIELQSWWAELFNSEELVKSAVKKLELLKHEQNLPDDTKLIVQQGKRHKVITDYATTIKARYIILADNYPLATGVKKLGSTLSQVIIKAEQPVISITNKEDTIFKNIAVPLDLNRSSRMQLYNSVAMALNHNAKIHLVSVLFGEKDIESSRINKKIEKYKKTYDENGVEYTVKLLVKEDYLAYKSIINYCEQNKLDSILIMTHNEAATFDNYLGAFAQHIINEATMPVVSINNASAAYWEKKLGDGNYDPLRLFPDKK
jgi:nucleotide-binding universal stress UspA family protein